MTALNTLSTESQLIANLLFVLASLYGFYRAIGRKFAKMIDERVQPELSRVIDKLVDHMNDEAAQTAALVASSKRVERRQKKLGRQVESHVAADTTQFLEVKKGIAAIREAQPT